VALKVSSTHLTGNPYPSRNLGLQIQRGETLYFATGILEPKICNPLARVQLLNGTKYYSLKLKSLNVNALVIRPQNLLPDRIISF